MTGCAAPVLVPGAMAAMSAASRMKNPAERRAAAAGRDVKDDGHGRVRDLLDDVASGFDEASGRIDLDQYSLVVAALGFVDGAGNVLLGDGLNGVVDDDFQDLGGRDGGKNESCQRGQGESARLECLSSDRQSSPEYSYSYFRLAVDISCARLPPASRGAHVLLQPGRVVLPVIRRAPRS